jgi:hypothetical protein
MADYDTSQMSEELYNIITHKLTDSEQNYYTEKQFISCRLAEKMNITSRDFSVKELANGSELVKQFFSWAHLMI